jgi:hypothetical protein
LEQQQKTKENLFKEWFWHRFQQEVAIQRNGTWTVV